MTYQVAISLDLFYANSNEINSWLTEHRGTSEFNSFVGPIPKLPESKAALIISFEDHDIAILFKLVWGGLDI
jgi:hypothetical protein